MVKPSIFTVNTVVTSVIFFFYSLLFTGINVTNKAGFSQFSFLPLLEQLFSPCMNVMYACCALVYTTAHLTHSLLHKALINNLMMVGNSYGSKAVLATSPILKDLRPYFFFIYKYTSSINVSSENQATAYCIYFNTLKGHRYQLYDTPIQKKEFSKLFLKLPLIFLDFLIYFSSSLGKHKATETRVMNVFITAVGFQS